MFLGEYEYTLDQKGRVAIPAKFRGGFKPGLVLARGFEKCIRVFPLDEWTKTAEKLIALPIMEANSRRLNRSLFSSAFSLELDGQGRVLLPQPLRDYAEIRESVVIAGIYSVLEIWSRENWEMEKGLMAGSMEQMPVAAM